jgi:hypothetical protein
MAKNAAGGIPMRSRGGGQRFILKFAGPQATAADFRTRPASQPAQAAQAAPTPIIPIPIPIPPAVEPLPIETLDRINRLILALCPLSEKHSNYLIGEGVDPTGCGTLAYKQASRIATRIVTIVGEDIARRAPALIEARAKDGRNWWTLASAADGLLLPATNVDGLVAGLQIRKDKPAGPDDRYRQVSHGGLGGTPLTVFKTAPGAASPNHSIISEGYKKCSVATKNWQCHAISLAGVSAYNVDELIRTVAALGVDSVSLAFDADKAANQNVARAEERLLNILAAAFPELAIFKLEWDGSAAKAKGLDDAVKAGCEFKFVPAAGTGPRLVTDLPAAAHARTFTTAATDRKMYTLTEAREQHRAFFDRLLLMSYPGPGPDGSQTALTSPTGTGKSTAGDDSLAYGASTGLLQGRWLTMAPNKDNIKERTVPRTELGKAAAAGYVAVQQGRRLIDLGDPNLVQTPFDCANENAEIAGKNRQITAQVVCPTCPFGSDDNWVKAYPDGSTRPWKCEVDGYLASRKASEKAQAVIATKESFLNNSDQLNDFDGIIVDEELMPFLMEIININSSILDGWRQKIGLKGIPAPEWERLFQVIDKASLTLAGQPNNTDDAAAAAAGQDLGYGGRLIDAHGHLEAAANSLGYDYTQILVDCDHYRRSTYEGVFDFEEPYSNTTGLSGTRAKVKNVFPFRGARELLDRLVDTDNPARFARGGDGSYSLVLHIPRKKLIETLRRKTLVVMDATLPPTLKILLPKLQELRFDVPQNIHITQTTNALFSKRDLHNPDTRARVEAANQSFAAGSKKHLTVLPLRFQEGQDALQIPSSASGGNEVEHWGLHRATSKYSDFDSITLLGHHIRPIDYIGAEVIAARAMAGQDNPTREGNAPAEKLRLRLRLYNHILPNGRAAGRWMKCDQDKDIQAAIEQEFAANIIQAIGRTRAALRSPQLPPVRVLILCNEPVGNLPIDLLTTTRELATTPPEMAIFTNNNYVKKSELGGLVPAYTDVMGNLDAWDDDLIQDETAETQAFTPDEWPDNSSPPLLE